MNDLTLAYGNFTNNYCEGWNNAFAKLVGQPSHNLEVDHSLKRKGRHNTDNCSAGIQRTAAIKKSEKNKQDLAGKTEVTLQC